MNRDDSGSRSQPARLAACRIAVDLNIFELLKDAGNESVVAKDIASRVNAEERFICE